MSSSAFKNKIGQTFSGFTAIFRKLFRDPKVDWAFVFIVSVVTGVVVSTWGILQYYQVVGESDGFVPAATTPAAQASNIEDALDAPLRYEQRALKSRAILGGEHDIPVMTK